MAVDNLDSPSFSIENTMEMGIGNRELIDTLFSPDSVTATSEEVEALEKPKKKVEKTTTDKTTKEEKPKEDPSKEVTKFLFDEDEEEEEQEEEPKPAAKKKVEKEEEQEQEEEGDGDDGEGSNTFSILSKELFKLGVFNKDEEEEDVDISTPEQLLERFKQEKQKGAIEFVEKFIGQFGEDYQNAFQAIFVKGVNPKEYFGAYNNIKDFSELDLTQEANQVAVIKQALADQGYEAEEITAEIERIKNYGDLETVAQRNHKVLVKKEAARIAQLQQESEQKLAQQATIKNQYIKNVQTVLQDRLQKKEFDGIPLNPKLASELQDFLLTDKYKTPSGETLTEFDRTILDLKRPENHEKKVKIALLMKILEKDPTLSTIQKTGVTKKTDALFGELARQTGKSAVKTDKAKKPNSWFS